MSFDHVGTEKEYSIADLAKAYGVSLRTLRFYEAKALLRPRRSGRTRYYNERDRTRLEIILRGKRLGFTLAEIAEMIASPRRALGQADSLDGTTGLALGAAQIAEQIALLERQREKVTTAIDELRRLFDSPPSARRDRPPIRVSNGALAQQRLAAAT